MVRLPPGARLSVRQPAAAGAALSSYAVNVPVVPHLVDRHEFFVAAGTPASVIGWMQRHRPAGSSQDDSGGGSAGEQWTSFAFRSVHGFAAWPDLVVNAVGARGSRVAVRVDAQVAPRPRLPGTGRGAGDVRVVELGTMLGSSGYELRCGPAGGTVPHPARICAAITRDPALLYSFPGPGHSCPPGAPAVSIAGSWNGKPLHSMFSVCTGGQKRQAGVWAGLLPSTTALGTVHIGQGIGLVSLGEREAAAIGLLRGPMCQTMPRRRSCGAGRSAARGQCAAARGDRGEGRAAGGGAGADRRAVDQQQGGHARFAVLHDVHVTIVKPHEPVLSVRIAGHVLCHCAVSCHLPGVLIAASPVPLPGGAGLWGGMEGRRALSGSPV